jgi:hypothetical protein
MKIQNLLEAIMDNDAPQFALVNVNTFDMDGDKVDGDIAIKDRNNGVVYAVSVEFDPKSKGYMIKDIDVNDNGTIHDGDATDAQLVKGFIDQHRDELLKRLLQDGMDYLGNDKPMNKPTE